MSGIVAFDDLFPLKANPVALDRVFGFDAGDGKSRGFTIQSILNLIAANPVTWAAVTGKPLTFAPAAHTIGSHSNVADSVDAAADGTFLKKVGGAFQAVAVDFYGVGNPPPADSTVPDPVRGITALRMGNWDSAFGWGNHAGQYRPVAWVPTWAEVTGKPLTFAPASHSLGSHSNVDAGVDVAANGTFLKRVGAAWEAAGVDFYSPTNMPPPDASVPDFVRGFTIGQFAGYEAKILEYAGFVDGAIPLIKDGTPVSSQVVGVYSVNPFDPVTQPVEYDAFVAELLHLVSAKPIKGVAAVELDEYVVKSQLEGLGGGGGSPSPILTDLDTFPILKFDKNYRYIHEMAGAIQLSVQAVTPLAVVGNSNKLYIKANGVNKPTLTGDFTVIWDNWVNTAGFWNRFYAEWSPQGKAVLQIENTHQGTANDGSGLTQLTINFATDNQVLSHVITNSTELVINSAGAQVGFGVTLYIKANGVNKPFWNSTDVVVVYDDWLNTVDVWNRVKLEWGANNKAIVQIINT
jgi:hypothetical protein